MIRVAQFHRNWEIAGAGLVTAYASFAGILLLFGLQPDDHMLAKLAWARIGQGIRKAVFV
jgi:hypothetical protein